MHFSTLAIACFAALTTAQTGNTTCPVQAKDPKPTGLYCGIMRTPIRGARNQLSSTTNASQQDCLNSCYNDPVCRSFTYDATSGSCRIFGATGKRMGLAQNAEGVSSRFYNINCFFQPDLNRCSADFTPRPFNIVVINNGTTYDGKFVSVKNDGALNPAKFVATKPGAEGEFEVEKDGTITSELVSLSAQQTRSRKNNVAYYTLYFPTTAETGAMPLVPVKCNVLATSTELVCQSPVGNAFYGCDDGTDGPGTGLAIKPAGDATMSSAGCKEIRLKAEYLDDAAA